MVDRIVTYMGVSFPFFSACGRGAWSWRIHAAKTYTKTLKTLIKLHLWAEFWLQFVMQVHFVRRSVTRGTTVNHEPTQHSVTRLSILQSSVQIKYSGQTQCGCVTLQGAGVRDGRIS